MTQTEFEEKKKDILRRYKKTPRVRNIQIQKLQREYIIENSKNLFDFIAGPFRRRRERKEQEEQERIEREEAKRRAKTRKTILMVILLILSIGIGILFIIKSVNKSKSIQKFEMITNEIEVENIPSEDIETYEVEQFEIIKKENVIKNNIYTKDIIPNIFRMFDSNNFIYIIGYTLIAIWLIFGGLSFLAFIGKTVVAIFNGQWGKAGSSFLSSAIAIIFSTIIYFAFREILERQLINNTYENILTIIAFALFIMANITILISLRVKKGKAKISAFIKVIFIIIIIYIPLVNIFMK